MSAPMCATCLAGVEQNHQAGVVERSEPIDLVSLTEHLVEVSRAWQHQLDGDRARELLVLGPVHGGRTTAADQAHHTIATAHGRADDVAESRGRPSGSLNRHTSLPCPTHGRRGDRNVPVP